MRNSLLLVVCLAAGAVLVPTAARAACNTPQQPEDDCDNDNCLYGFGDCNDKDPSIRGAACPGGAAPEICDGKDNNCAGGADEGNPDAGTQCSTGQPGMCAAGLSACTGGQVVCNKVNTSYPKQESCNGLDDDCDGDTDEIAGIGSDKIMRACFTGLGTPDAGICRMGDQACNAAPNANAESWTTCGTCSGLAPCRVPVYAQHPANQSEQRCDGLDNDCDGVVDDGNPDGGQACTTPLLGECRAGTTACTNGNIVCNQNKTSVSETCDGLDNDCDGDRDETGNVGSPKLTSSCFDGPGTAGVGTCVSGTRGCVAAVDAGAPAWTTCGTCANCTPQVVAANPPAQPETTCDNRDDDCDGTRDDGDPGGGMQCITALPGVCRVGTFHCVSSSQSVLCVSNNSPASSDTCDGLDNDCDGDIDESGAPGSGKVQRDCYTGPNGTVNVGICRNGKQACNAAVDAGTASWDTCGICSGPPPCVMPILPENTPAQAESKCDNRDEDCDGNRDDGLGVGTICTVAGVGRCGTGVVACASDAGTQCNANTAISERCNGVDDNCDGNTDENNPDGGAACNVSGQQGVCRNGHRVCSGGTLTCPQENFATAESCNGLDDNCDGQTDNGIPTVGNSCATGLPGTCAMGTLRCRSTAGIYSVDCVPNTPALPSEVNCDGLDEDCDGTPDNNVPARACYTGPVGTFAGTCPGAMCRPLGICRTGTQSCSGGSWGACTGQTLPGPVELCDSLDNNCNGSNNEGLIFDLDNDMYRACGTCGANDAGSCDCNDNPDGGFAVKPGVQEQCNAVDDNCNSRVDEGNGPTMKITRNCYSGPSGTQGHGVCVAGVQECTATVVGMATYGTCVGERTPSNTPSASELACNGADDDCDDKVDDGFDTDNDGFVACSFCSTIANCDCDDQDANINPNAPETCDTVDNNCDGRLDDVPTRKCFSNATGMNPPVDRYTGICPGPTCAPKPVCVAGTQTCTAAGAWGACSNVTLPTAEACNALDDDCNGQVDDANFDMDNDGALSCALCNNRPGCDCDDANATVKPGAPEVCDGIDNNCDGTTDGVSTACYSGPPNTRGQGVCHDGTQQCLNGVGTGACSGDRTPTPLSGGRVPQFVDGGTGDPEATCDGIDEDCDGVVDDGFDSDGDGVTTCQGDCDDTNKFNKDGGVEICDCADNNCDGVPDEGSVCYGAPCHDFDGDKYTNCDGDCDDDPATGGNVNPSRTEVVGDNVDNDCDGRVDEDTDEDQDMWSTGQGDCDDRNADVHPGAKEVCDGIDNNCDTFLPDGGVNPAGGIDEGFDQDRDFVSICARDCNDDPDGGALQSPVLFEVCGNGKDDNCDGRIDEDTDYDQDGVSTCEGDRNDFNPDVHPAHGVIPAALEVCDGQDNDGDRVLEDGGLGHSFVDEGFDNDGDNQASCFFDCDDNDPTVNRAAPEIPNNGKDDNCNGEVDEGFLDRDNDGFTPQCGDCNDFNASVNPHANEMCDRIDNNCDGYVDSAFSKFDLCAVCFDADNDQQTNCAGDCNDANKDVYRGAPEVCDGLDNDCDNSIDLDPVTGTKVCTVTGPDGGPTDAGTDGGPDAGPIEPDVDSGVVDAGSTTKPRVLPVVVTSCGCGSTDASGLAVIAGLALMTVLRRRKASARVSSSLIVALTVSMVALSAGSLSGCLSTVRVPTGDEDLDGGGTGPGDDGGPVVTVDAGPFDAGFVEPFQWPCPGLQPLLHDVAEIPGAANKVAFHPTFQTATNQLGHAVLLDSPTLDVSAMYLALPLPPAVDGGVATNLEAVTEQGVKALENLVGTPLVRSVEERGVKLTIDTIRLGAVAAQNATFSRRVFLAAGTTAFSVRNRLLASLTGKAPADFGTLPSYAGATTEPEMSVSLVFRIDSQAIIVGAAVTPASLYDANEILVRDVTNGSHISLPNFSAQPDYTCNEGVTPALKTDFLFVIDNTPSMAAAHAALKAASQGLFEAFQRSRLDFRIGVITTDSQVLRGEGFTSDQQKYLEALEVGNGGNTFEMGIDFAYKAIKLARQAGDPKRQLRSNAGLVVVFISDEDSKLNREMDLIVDDYKNEKAVSFAIVGPNPRGCVRAAVARSPEAGSNYIELSNRTGGSSGSICNPNVSEIIEEIVIGALGASSQSNLSETPISGSLAVRSSNVNLPRSRRNGFDFEPRSNSILFFGASAPTVGAKYQTAYEFFRYPQ